MNPYEVLGVSEDASASDIVAAYRRLAKERHPDAARGSKSAFEELCLARNVLMNPKSRKHFDETGELLEVEPDNANAEVALRIKGGIWNAIEIARGKAHHSGGLLSAFSFDFLELAKQNLAEHVLAIDSQIKDLSKRLAFMREAATRFEASTQPDIIGDIFRADIKSMEASIRSCVAEAQKTDAALNVLKSYTFRTEGADPAPAALLRLEVSDGPDSTASLFGEED